MSPNVALASGELYPNGVDYSPAPADIQATVRPGGWLFRPSPGYPSVRVGNHKIDLNHPQGTSIHFTPQRFAENLQPGSGMPAMVDVRGADHADIADLPGSELLDGDGNMPAYLAAQNRGPLLGDSVGHIRTGDVPRHGGNTPRDMGDRSFERPTTRAFYDRLAVNPNVVLRDEWRADPVASVIWAGIVIGGLSLAVHTIEKAIRGGNRGRGVAATATEVPAAAATETAKVVESAVKPVVEAVKEVEKTAEKSAEKIEEAVT